MGATYISSEATCAIASDAVLRPDADHFDSHDAVLFACCGDPGLLVLREIAPVPAFAMAQVSFMAAAALGFLLTALCPCDTRPLNSL